MRISPINLVTRKNQTKVNQNFNVNNNVSLKQSADKFEKNISFAGDFNPNDYWTDKKIADYISTNPHVGRLENYAFKRDLKRIQKVQELIKHKDAERIEKMFEDSGKTVDEIYKECCPEVVVWTEKKQTPDGKDEVIYHGIKELDKFDSAGLLVNDKKVITDNPNCDRFNFAQSETSWKDVRSIIDTSEYKCDKYFNFMNEFACASDIGDYIRTRDIFQLLRYYQPLKSVESELPKINVLPTYAISPLAPIFAAGAKWAYKKYCAQIQNDYFVLQLAKKRDASQDLYNAVKANLCASYRYALEELERKLGATFPIDDYPELMKKFLTKNYNLDAYSNIEPMVISNSCQYYNDANELWEPNLTQEEIVKINNIIPPEVQKAALNNTPAGMFSLDLCKMDAKAELLAGMPLKVQTIRTEKQILENYDPQNDPYYWND